MDGITPVSDLGLQLIDSGKAINAQPAILRTPTDPAQSAEEKKKQLAKDFESVLITKLFDQVRESISQAGLGDEDDDGASQQVHGLFWLYLAQDVADKGGFGLWREIYSHFSDIGAGTTGALIDSEL